MRTYCVTHAAAEVRAAFFIPSIIKLYYYRYFARNIEPNIIWALTCNNNSMYARNYMHTRQRLCSVWQKQLVVTNNDNNICVLYIIIITIVFHRYYLQLQLRI